MIHLVFDGNNTAIRCDMTSELYTRAGERTSAIMGALNSAHSVIEQLNDQYRSEGHQVCEVIFAWDRGHSERRKKVFPEYKANRHKTERTEEEQKRFKELITQMNILYDNLHMFGVKCIRKDGWEGDDLIYGVCKALTQRYPDDLIFIVSTDEDFHQLVKGNVGIYSPIKKVFYTSDNYKEMTGIDQNLFLTYKLLKGDSSDGISGIEGIGDKTAKSLVNTYGDLGGLLNHKDELMKSKRTARIFTPEGLETLDRNNQLINLADFVDLTPVEDDINMLLDEVPFVDENAANKFLMRWQLMSILAKGDTWMKTFRWMEEAFPE